MHSPPANGWDLERLHRFFPIDEVACKLPGGRAAVPGSEILAIAAYQGRNYLVTFHWGLVPSWAKNTALGARLINARSETLTEKPSFRKAFAKRRCLIIAEGFIEWQNVEGEKRPIYFTVPGKAPMGFAGLWEKWKPKQPGNPIYRSCTIITIAASEHIKPYHHRMPAVLKPDQYASWLDTRHRDTDLLSEMLRRHVYTEFETSDPPPGTLTSATDSGV